MMDWAWRRGLRLAVCVMVWQERADAILAEMSVVWTAFSGFSFRLHGVYMCLSSGEFVDRGCSEHPGHDSKSKFTGHPDPATMDMNFA